MTDSDIQIVREYFAKSSTVFSENKIRVINKLEVGRIIDSINYSENNRGVLYDLLRKADRFSILLRPDFGVEFRFEFPFKISSEHYLFAPVSPDKKIEIPIREYTDEEIEILSAVDINDEESVADAAARLVGLWEDDYPIYTIPGKTWRDKQALAQKIKAGYIGFCQIELDEPTKNSDGTGWLEVIYMSNKNRRILFEKETRAMGVLLDLAKLDLDLSCGIASDGDVFATLLV